MPDAVAAPHRICDALPDHELIRRNRKPALPGFIWRKVLSTPDLVDFKSRDAYLATCRAEMAWAYADWVRVMTDRGVGLGTRAAEMSQLPHENAAATVLAAWEQLQPIEYRAIECWRRLQAQRREGWHDRAKGSAADLRRYLTERRKCCEVFQRAVDVYAQLRSAVDQKVS